MHACMDYQRRPVAIAADNVDQLGRRQPRQLGFRGIVSKRLGSPYRSGRSRHWIKSKKPPSAHPLEPILLPAFDDKLHVWS
jgi:ATP-dependent DNA ligase